MCGKAYKSTSALNRHSLSAHSSLTYKCKYCPTEYKRTDNQNRNMALKHGEFAIIHPHNWGGFPNHKTCDTEYYPESGASSPIKDLEGLPTLVTKVSEINPPTLTTPVECKIFTGRADRFVPRQRKWTLELWANLLFGNFKELLWVVEFTTLTELYQLYLTFLKTKESVHSEPSFSSFSRQMARFCRQWQCRDENSLRGYTLSCHKMC